MAGRRERERERHRKEILGAAAALLAERGPDGLTMDEVARRSEFAVGSIYRHFKSKEQLVEALVADHLAPFFAEVARIAAEDGAFEQLLDRFLAAWVRTLNDTRPIWRMVLLARGDGFTPPAHATIEAMIGYFEALEALIERGQVEGALADVDAWLLVAAVHGMLAAYAKRAVFGLEVDLDEAMGVVRRAVLRGFAPA